MLDAQVEISQRTLDSWAETIRALKVMSNVGESNNAAVAQAEANRLSVEATVLTLRQQISEQENSLATLVGMTAQPVNRSSLEGQTFPDSLMDGVPLNWLGNRPDIHQAEYNLQSAGFAIRVARAAFYPQVTLSGSLGWINTDGSVIVNPGKWLLNAIGSLVQPVFNRGRNKANFAVTQARQEEAKVALQRKLLDAGAEVNNALKQWQTAQNRLNADAAQIEQLRKAEKSTRLLMENSDLSSYLELLTAQQTLLQAELNQVQNVFYKIQGIINLYHAVGGGLQ